MRKILSFMGLMAMSASAAVAAPTTARPSMVSQYMGPRQIASAPAPVSAPAAISSTPRMPDVTAPVVEPPLPEPDNHERERIACINNNIGVGNTFVWASRFSDVGNYAGMIEDIENPENNVCWVRVELKSDDVKINVADVAPVYREFGQTIKCGSWADANKIKQRILDAKKNARTWGTVAGAVGGAGVGVGVMELFGNRAIGGAVQGQKALGDEELFRSQMLALKNDKDPRYAQLKSAFAQLDKDCNDTIWSNPDAGEKPEDCSQYQDLITIMNGI